ncbi:MAG: TolC family protein [Saprospiraceae bacterium]
MTNIAKSFFSALLILFTLPLVGQETWSLQRCVQHSQEANLTVLQARSNAKVAVVAERQAKTARLPNVSISSSLGQQFGRTIDPTTNQFVTTGITSNSMSLNAGMPLYGGGQINQSIKLARWNAQAAAADADQTANTVALQVAQAYLSILLAEEQRASADRRVGQSQRQLEATKKLVEAGTVPAADRFNVQAQIAREEQLAVQAHNNVELAYLNLKQLLQLEPDYDLRIEKPVVTIPADVNPENYSLQPVYAAALQSQPNVKASAFRVKSAEAGVALAKSQYLPSLSLFGGLSSFYSSQFLDFANGKLINTELSNPITVRVNNTDVTLQQYVSNYDFPKVAYTDQLDRNFGQSFGLQLNVPIYQNGAVRLKVERARLDIQNAQLQENQTRQQLKNDIQTSIANARAARKQLDAAQRTFDAMQAAFANTEKRHSLGAANTLELTTAKTNIDNAENDLITARYDYLFKLKILDFYQGKELRL